LSTLSKLTCIRSAICNVLSIFPQTNTPGLEQLTGGEAWAFWHGSRFNEHNHLDLLPFLAGKPGQQYFTILLDHFMHPDRFHNFLPPVLSPNHWQPQGCFIVYDVRVCFACENGIPFHGGC
jgi:hypothetical protein